MLISRLSNKKKTKVEILNRKKSEKIVVIKIIQDMKEIQENIAQVK